MYKLMIALFTSLVLFTPIIYAKNEDTSIQNNNKDNQVESGIGVENQNQLKTQNQGEETQLKVSTSEEEKAETETSRGDTAQDKMSEVAKTVETILSTQSAEGGIGEQIRTTAQTQKTAQIETQSLLNKIESRSNFVKKIIGPDFKALKSMEQIMEQNRIRIEELNQLKLSVTNQGDFSKVQEMIQALEEQNTELQTRLNLEQRSSGLFGWLVKLFVK